MQENELICPFCGYRERASLFANVGGGQIMCRRCRSPFSDPNAYDPHVVYADCDSRRAVTRYPFSLEGEEALLRVRGGYLALLSGAVGQRTWIEAGDCRIRESLGGFQLYYVCLNPRVSWGVSGPEGFGAYGTASLSLSPAFVKSFCGMDGNILALEDYLKKAVSRHIADRMRLEIQRQSTGLLENRDVYMGMAGALEEGVSLTQVDPRGFRTADGRTGAFSSALRMDELPETPEPAPAFRAPAEALAPPRTAYTIAHGVEEVFCFGADRMTRHKAGEAVNAELLRGVGKVVRFRAKAFEFPFGWGICNQPQGSGFYSAQGTISFYIDSTEKFSRLLLKSASWQEFETLFFKNVLKKELAYAMRAVLAPRVSVLLAQPERIGGALSAMSVELTNALNGEDGTGERPAFREHGLRVKQADIMGIEFYPIRR